MTDKHAIRGPHCRCSFVLSICLVATALNVITERDAAAQLPPRVHPFHHEFLPPGQIAQEQLWRSPSMGGYVQAVELIPPEGAQVAVVQNGAFQASPSGPVLAGMQLGYVYSVKLTRLPHREGIEIFATIEIINRLHPPEGTKTRFPVPIELAEDDIAQALQGLFVTRVVYLEDPDHALPTAEADRHQRTLDVSPREDPLHVADRLGRPMAIVRMGSRLPDEAALALTESQLPPVILFPNPRSTVAPVNVNDAIERHGADIPRESADRPVRGAVVPSSRPIRR